MFLEQIMNINAPFSLPPAALHEFYADRGAEGAALCGLGLASAGGAAPSRPLLWVRQEVTDRERGAPCSTGLDAHGFASSRLILVRTRDMLATIQAGLEGARTPGLAAVMIELWGDGKVYDLTASRRLSLAAKVSGAMVLVCRLAASPVPSAADTRWQARALPSRALAAQAPGNPTFEITLLRARSGQEGLRYCLEWDRDTRELVPRSLPATRAPLARSAPLSGASVPVPFDRKGAPASSSQRLAG